MDNTGGELKTTSDEELAAMVCSGDRAARAFEELHSRYAGIVLAVVGSILRNGSVSEAQDVSQMAWLKVWQSIRSQFDGRDFRAWLLTIAKTKALDELRRKRGVPLSPEHDPAAREADARDDEAVRRIRVLKDCIDKLDAERRNVVEMWLAQKTHQEIAQALAIKPDTSMTRLHRAKHILRECVEARLT
jgi:RNA polymerase sigma factor (sigma-70 family)